jgi:hypothetical protein
MTELSAPLRTLIELLAASAVERVCAEQAAEQAQRLEPPPARESLSA